VSRGHPDRIEAYALRRVMSDAKQHLDGHEANLRAPCRPHIMLMPFVIGGAEYIFVRSENPLGPDAIAISAVTRRGENPTGGWLPSSPPILAGTLVAETDRKTWLIANAANGHEDVLSLLAAHFSAGRATQMPERVEPNGEAFLVTCTCGRLQTVLALPRVVRCDCGAWLSARG
jgi:hypothetical protein